MADGGWQIGIDIGGTFTDVVCLGPGGAAVVFKLPSTRSDPSRAVAAALARLAAEHGVALDRVTRFCHGTTVATNAVIEHKGARTGILTTEGFGDILDLGRQIRRQMYDLHLRPETPGWLAPRARRAEVSERIGPDGAVIAPLDEDSLRRAIARLRAEGVEAVAVCLIFGFLAPAHERRIREVLAEEAPDWAVSLSCDVDPVFREYERLVATAFDAYVKPLVADYLGRMDAALAEAGAPARLQVMQSRGGLAGAALAQRRPVRLLLSGPAAGVLGARAVAAAAGIGQVISIDVGGTSSDIALLPEGPVPVRAEMKVDGFDVRVPTIDIATLGAGGGSVAWIDAAGGLRVGPHSAGAEPGPACYGQGGTEPTVTDASVVLGYLDPARFSGGRLALDPELAARAIEARIARPLGMTLTEAALGIHRVVNAQMADGIRLVSVRRGIDPRGFALVALGGGGGIHAAALAAGLGLTRILVPRFPGVLSAAGLLAAPIEHERSAALHLDLAGADPARLAAVFADLDAEVAALMAEERTEGLRASRRHSVDMAYAGQSHLIEVPWAPDAPDPLAALYAAFEEAHTRINGHATGAPARIVNLRAVHQAHPPAPQTAAPPADGDADRGSRDIHLPGFGRLRATILDRAALPAGATLAGPAVLEQDDTTTLIPPGWRAEVHPSGGIALTREATP